MTTKVLVPLLGEGVEEVTVSKWLKHEGDSVKELEPLVEVNTDKVDTEIPSPATGIVLKIEMQEGQPARVGATLAVIGQEGEKAESAISSGAPGAVKTVQPKQELEKKTDITSQTKTEPGKQGSAAPSTQPSGEVGFVSPVVARIAAEKRIDLNRVMGTGLNGRITKNDVLKFAESGGSMPASTRVAKAAPAMSGDQLIKHTLIRRQIAEHMLRSRDTSPHVLTVMEADMSRVAAHRASNKATFNLDGINLTYTAYFIKALVEALKAHPLANSSWTEEGVLVHKDINLGMAVSLGDEGLIVPVIKSAENLSLLALAKAINDLGNRARTKKLQPEEVKGGTFTLTNHGTAGSLLAMPIINQPQCGILGTGVLQKRVVAVTDADGYDSVAIRPMVYLSLVFDHRILDGASADAFLGTVKEELEGWS
jgi:2-oxoglutarate dehydrogenase E2 component (dihydrolipoamide succinyltransferase)